MSYLLPFKLVYKKKQILTPPRKNQCDQTQTARLPPTAVSFQTACSSRADPGENTAPSLVHIRADLARLSQSWKRSVTFC